MILTKIRRRKKSAMVVDGRSASGAGEAPAHSPWRGPFNDRGAGVRDPCKKKKKLKDLPLLLDLLPEVSLGVEVEAGEGVSGGFFHGAEAVLELGGGAAQRAFGVDVELAGEVDGGEQQVAHFVLDAVGVSGGDGFADFLHFLVDFGHHVFGGSPVKADAGGAGLDLLSAEEGGKGGCDA